MATKQCPDIMRWIPSTWDQFQGNAHLKRFLKRMIKSLRGQMESNQPLNLNRLPMLIKGLSRSGKTALVKHFIRCLFCRRLNMATLEPCQACGYCLSQVERHGLEEFEHYDVGSDNWYWAEHKIQFIPIDCTKIYTPTELRTRLNDLGEYEAKQDLVVVYLDEVHRLVPRSMDEILLKAVEEVPFVWILSTAKPAALEDMLKNRVIKLETELPNSQELATWLCDRCDDWGIPWAPEAILRVVEKSNCVPGKALHALALAATDLDEGLTLELVENDWILEANA